MQPLSVLQVLPALETGGVERGTLEIAAALVEAGHRSHVLSSGGRLVEQLTQSGTEHIAMPVHRKSLMSFRLIPAIRALIADKDIVHFRSRMPGWLVYLAWRTLPRDVRPALVTTVHGLYSVNKYSAIMTRGERIIAISEAVKRYILTSYPATPEAHIRLIHRGVSDEEFPRGFQPEALWLNQWRQQQPQLDGRILLTLPGRITRWKGHEAFLRLVSHLARRLDVHGLIVGETAPNKTRYRQLLEKSCWRLGIEDRVSFLGNRSDIKEIYAISDIVFNLSTHAEPFGRTMIEALSMGRPVVAWNYGGAAESVGALFPDGLVEPHDEDALVATSLRIINGHCAPPARNTFLVSQMQRQTLDVYYELVAERDAVSAPLVMGRNGSTRRASS